MEKIASFTIDHTKLLPGIYVSRKDNVNGNVVTTGKLELVEKGKLIGDIKTGSLSIAETAIFHGNCKMQADTVATAETATTEK